MSWCGGPPGRKIMITDLFDFSPVAASARSTSESVRPPKASPPICKNPRRLMRSQ